jgi:hypothetical protein
MIFAFKSLLRATRAAVIAASWAGRHWPEIPLLERRSSRHNALPVILSWRNQRMGSDHDCSGLLAAVPGQCQTFPILRRRKPAG